MPFAAIGAIGGAVSAGIGLSNALGGSSSGGGGTGSTNVWQPSTQLLNNNANSLYANLGSYSGIAGNQLSSAPGAINSAVGAIQNNPYIGTSIGSNVTAGDQSIGAGYQTALNSDALNNQARSTNQNNNALLSREQSLLGQQTANTQAGQAAATQLLATGFDPQNAIYNQQQQANSDQSNAINAMNGLGGSPYGAGVANQSNINFNNAWQNSLEARQAQALQGYNQSLQLGNANVAQYGALQNQGSANASNYGATLGAASNLGTQSAQQYSQGGNYAYNAANTIYGNNLNALGSGYQAFNTASQPYNNLLTAQQAFQSHGAAENLAGAQYQNAYNGQQAQNITSGLSQVGNFVNGGGFNRLFGGGATQYSGGGVGAAGSLYAGQGLTSFGQPLDLYGGG